MNVLLTIPDLCAATGGPPAVVTRLAAELLDAGDAVTLIFAEKPDGPLVPIPPGIQVRALPWQSNPWRRYQQFRLAALKVIHTARIRVVHDHGLWLPQNAAAARAASEAGCALVVQPCGMMQTWSLAQQATKKRVAWWLYQKWLVAGAHAVVATSDRERCDALLKLGKHPEVHCIPHGVDLPDLSMPLVRKRQAVFLGRLHPVKQLEVLLSAWAEIRPSGWQLCIAGSGDSGYEASLKAKVEALGVGVSVEFMGAVHGAAKAQLLLESQLYLQPSQQENFGLSVAEALAHGLPALTTHAMPWAQLEALRCGWSVPADAASVTTALRSALSLSAEELSEMGHRARKLASAYAWSETARATRALYAQIGA